MYANHVDAIEQEDEPEPRYNNDLDEDINNDNFKQKLKIQKDKKSMTSKLMKFQEWMATELTLKHTTINNSQLLSRHTQ